MAAEARAGAPDERWNLRRVGPRFESYRDIVPVYQSVVSGVAMRTLVDIPKEDLEMIGAVTAKLGISRAEFVRRALTASLVPYRDADRVDAFGILQAKLPDGVAYQEKVRGEW